MKKLDFKLLVLIVVLGLFGSPIFSQINFPISSSFKYLKGSDADLLSASWKMPSFDDATWQAGSAPFRYGDGTGGTLLSDMQNSYSCVYLRGEFTVENAALIEALTLRVNYDDGFVLWINGTEVTRKNAPDILSNTAFAPQNHESGAFEALTMSTNNIPLNEGINTLAVQGFNISLTSSDFYFDLEMEATPALPKLGFKIGAGFSQASGFYDAPFDLYIISPDPLAKVVYTLDGTNPNTSPTAIQGTDMVFLPIDPNSTVGRAATPMVMVRAALQKDGFKPSSPEGRSFIFLDKVKTQSHPGGSWPSSDVNGQRIDLDVDAEVVNDPLYSADFDLAMKDIPSLCISTDIDNLFDPSTGIYVNPYEHGYEWERECSIEQINPDGTKGFQQNGGVRIRGGWSRAYDNPKHSFRLFFRDEYGGSDLDYSLFGKEGANEFEKVDLRTAQNYSWSYSVSDRMSFVREVFSRDTQRDMGRPHTRSQYYHLYLNGMYWGMFQTQERSEARYAAEYFGGDKDDYDVIKVDAAGGYVNEATDGNLDAWQEIYNLCLAGFSSNEAYFQLEGKDANGERDLAHKVLVDIDNLIDYMLIIFYTGNRDAPMVGGNGNYFPNNYYAIYNHADDSKGFQFFAHDSEHSMLDVNMNRVTIGMDAPVIAFNKFNPQWLHVKLSENAEYRQRFSDRALMHLMGEGVFTPDKCLERLQERVDQIDMAIIGESARWGDSQRAEPYTKNEDWIKEIDIIKNDFISSRRGKVISQLEAVNLFSNIESPVVKRDGEILDLNQYALSENIEISITNPNASGEIYYALAGVDPRAIGGGIASDAINISSGTTLQLTTSTFLKLRILQNGKWSGLKTITFNKYSDIKVTELNYHPESLIVAEDTTSGKSFEFIEFKNTGTSAIDMYGMVLDSAVYYKFPLNTVLDAQQFYVIATKPGKFQDRYGMESSGNCNNFFSNAGEKVVLSDPAGNQLISFVYDDLDPWPMLPDGGGYTLTAKEINPTGDPNNFAYWRSSSVINGTPFADDLVTSVFEEEAENNTNNFSLYPNPCYGQFTVRFNGNDDEENVCYISDLKGRIIYHSIINEHTTIDLSKLGVSKGIYIVKVVNGADSHHAKVIYY